MILSITVIIQSIMKTEISIPNKIFDAAEQLASSRGMSRSDLYSKAVLEYLNKHKYLDVTETLNKVYSKSDSSLNSEFYIMQISSLKK